MPQRFGGLWRHADFMKLWAGQTVSEFGSHITGMALPLTAILVFSASPAEMGLLAAIGSAPVLIVGLLAGVWADRVRRRPILIAADLGRAVVLGSIPLMAALGLLRMEQLYVAAGLAEVLTVFFEISGQSFLPSVVSREHLVEGNSKLGTSSSLAEIGGPALAGSLVQWITAPLAILLDALSFLFSALCIGLIRTPEPAPAPAVERGPIWSEMLEGLQVVLTNRSLRAVVASSATLEFFGNFFATLYTLYAIRELGLTPAIVGLLIGLGGVSALVGTLLAGRVVLKFGLGPTIIGALAFYGCLQLLVPLAGGTVLVAAAFLAAAQLLGDVAIAIYFIAETSLRQALVPDRLLGRANASARVLVGGAALVGALVGGVLGGIVGMRLTLAIAVLGMILGSLWMVFSPVRKMRGQPEPVGAVPQPEEV